MKAKRNVVIFVCFLGIKSESKIVKNAFISENFEFQLYLKVKIEQIWLQTKAKCLSYTMRPFSKLFDVNSRAEKGFPYSNFVQALHGVTWRSWKLDKKSMTLFPKSTKFAKSASFHFSILVLLTKAHSDHLKKDSVTYLGS